MNHIIGTAGHVDHGKSALIKALTGIETMHLPEEKKRQMTIDLGFAFFENSDKTPIGVIDVPGHERFIRNMVSGVWSLDCVLLVVAADDGWMRMTTDHLKVADALGIKKIILVITKTDLADSETLELVTEEAKENCGMIIGRVPPVVYTSSVTGEGIEWLKRTIIDTLAAPDGKEEGQVPDDNPLVLIDRVFTLQGLGTTVTGSLKYGALSLNDEVLLYPGSIPGKIKSIQSHHRSMEKVYPSSRVALNIKLSRNPEIRRGMVIAGRGMKVFTGTEVLVQLDSGKNEKKIKNHKEIELAFGTSHETGTLHFTGKDCDTARVTLKNDIAFYWNQPGVIMPHGGNTISGSFRFIWEGKTGRKERELIAGIKREKNPKTYPELLVRVEGMMKAGSLPPAHGSGDLVYAGGWVFDRSFLSDAENRVISLLSENPSGLDGAEIASLLKLPRDAADEILKLMRTGARIMLYGRLYRLFSAETDSGEGGDARLNLSPSALRILEEAEKAGRNGIVVSKLGIPGGQKEARGLVRAGLLVHLEDGLFYGRNTYEEVKKAILDGTGSGGSFTIAEAKDKTSLSRKYIIPLLNAMEEEKLIKRDNDIRLVL